MNDEINYKNNPLHGLGLKTLLEHLIEQYGFDVLYAYMNINCFKVNPSVASSVKFLKKTEWAREKVEGFYLYQYKNLPKPSSEQYEIPPRDRIIPDSHTPSEPAVLSIEDAARLQEKRAKKAAAFGTNNSQGRRSSTPYGSSRDSYTSERTERPKHDDSSNSSSETGGDPWGAWRDK